MLVEFGPLSIGLPHVRPLDGKLWELRLKGFNQIGRSIYLLSSKKRIFILHTFIKKTEKTPRKAIDVARKRSQEIQDD